MSQYSELIGSFIRTGNFPLEANYLFSSKEELDEFYKDEVNKASLHKGLFKVVDDGSEQKLYWAVEGDSGELEFQEFSGGNSGESIQIINATMSTNDLGYPNIIFQDNFNPKNIYELLKSKLVIILIRNYSEYIITIPQGSQSSKHSIVINLNGQQYITNSDDSQQTQDLIPTDYCGIVHLNNNDKTINISQLVPNYGYQFGLATTAIEFTTEIEYPGKYEMYIRFYTGNTVPTMNITGTQVMKTGTSILQKNTYYIMHIIGATDNFTVINITEIPAAINPTITNPSAAISFTGGFSNNGIYEIGSTAPTADNLNVTFNRGKATVPGQADKFRAGEQTGVTKQYNNTQSFELKVISGQMLYNAIVSYSVGDTLVTSEGNKATNDSNGSPIENPLSAGSVTSNNISIFGTYPYFCNGQSCSTSQVDSRLPTEVTPDTKLPLQKLTDTLVGAKFASEASTKTRLLFEFPSIKNVTKVEYMNTLSGKWEMLNIGEFDITTNGEKTIQGQQVAYSKITTNSDLKGALQCRFTVSNA